MNEPVTLHTSTYPQPLALSVSAYSARGAKPVNQDAYSYHIDTSQPEASSVFVIAISFIALIGADGGRHGG